MPLKNIIKWELIGLVGCIVESHLSGTYFFRYIDISTSGFIKKLLQKYWKRPPQDSPYLAAAKEPIQKTSPNNHESSKDQKIWVKQVMGSIFSHVWASFVTQLMALSTIGTEQSKAAYSFWTQLNNFLITVQCIWLKKSDKKIWYDT